MSRKKKLNLQDRKILGEISKYAHKLSIDVIYHIFSFLAQHKFLQLIKEGPQNIQNFQINHFIKITYLRDIKLKNNNYLNLTRLEINNYKLEYISEELISLRKLDIYCTSINYIPNTLINLESLVCNI